MQKTHRKIAAAFVIKIYKNCQILKFSIDSI